MGLNFEVQSAIVLTAPMGTTAFNFFTESAAWIKNHCSNSAWVLVGFNDVLIQANDKSADDLMNEYDAAILKRK